MFEEDQILVGGSLEAAVRRNQSRALSVKLHQRRAVVALLETVPGLSKRRQLVPTRPYVTRPRDTMTFTLGLGQLVHRLLTHRIRKK